MSYDRTRTLQRSVRFCKVVMAGGWLLIAHVRPTKRPGRAKNLNPVVRYPFGYLDLQLSVAIDHIRR
jgi:hypothetical protein